MSTAITTPVPLASAGGAAAAAGPFEAAAPMRSNRRRVPAAGYVMAVDAAVVTMPLFLQLASASAERSPAHFRDLLSLRLSIQDMATLLAFAAAVAVVFEAAGLYDADRVRRWASELGRALLAAAALAACGALVMTFGHPGLFDGPALTRAWMPGILALVTARAARTSITRTVTGCRRALIVGSGPQSVRICRELSTDPLTSYRVLGFVDTSVSPRSRFMARRTLGSLDQLEAILVREHVDEVHIGLPVRSHYQEIQETIRICERVGVKLMYRADIFDTALARPRVGGAVGAGPRVELRVVTDGVPLVVKRAIDLVGAAALLILLAPLLVLTAVAIKCTSPGPVLFAQTRYGLNRSRFRMLKFRTMVPDAERLQASLESRNEAQGPVFKIANDPRITPLGRWLRRTSIDELPQLFNVLAGDMSLVGPRPLPIRDVVQFTRSSDMRRFSVRPGLTGLWQVSGRSRLGFDQWIGLDLRYIDQWSLALDFAILARTIPAVLRGTGAS